MHGIYRPCPGIVTGLDLPTGMGITTTTDVDGEALLHPKYRLPSRCFAYIGSAADVHSWKLPYLLDNGDPDIKRLPKAIQSILSNYRGVKVDIPRTAVGDVLVRLGIAATMLPTNAVFVPTVAMAAKHTSRMTPAVLANVAA